tara:strand:+ start:207 stop:365 length:159 start_codon:yes stop_codon:yes gene_type:complete
VNYRRKRRIKKIIKKVEYISLGVTMAVFIYMAMLASTINKMEREEKMNNIKY